MKNKDIERYTIPNLTGEMRYSKPPEGTSVRELIEALLRLPGDGLVSHDFGGSNIFVTHYKPDIEVVV